MEITRERLKEIMRDDNMHHSNFNLLEKLFPKEYAEIEEEIEKEQSIYNINDLFIRKNGDEIKSLLMLVGTKGELDNNMIQIFNLITGKFWSSTEFTQYPVNYITKDVMIKLLNGRCDLSSLTHIGKFNHDGSRVFVDSQEENKRKTILYDGIRHK